MRFDGPESSNVEYDSGRSPALGGMGGGIIGLLFQLVLSRFGIVGLIILGLGYCALTSLGGGLGGGGGGTASSQNGKTISVSPDTDKFARQVLGSTEQVWGQIFQQSGARYTPTVLHWFSNAGQSGCGVAQSAMGPFYCPTDKKIYLDEQFFGELARRFQAPGDFAQAYVIAHEVGHHVQDLQGTLDQAQSAQQSMGQAEGNRVQVGIELQADCYAGVWAKRSGALEQGDIEEGMRAAEAIGDDTLQKESQGRVMPETFTHGTSAQRMQALRTGLDSGDPAQCRYNQ